MHLFYMYMYTPYDQFLYVYITIYIYVLDETLALGVLLPPEPALGQVCNPALGRQKAWNSVSVQEGGSGFWV